MKKSDTVYSPYSHCNVVGCDCEGRAHVKDKGKNWLAVFLDRHQAQTAIPGTCGVKSTTLGEAMQLAYGGYAGVAICYGDCIVYCDICLDDEEFVDPRI